MPLPGITFPNGTLIPFTLGALAAIDDAGDIMIVSQRRFESPGGFQGGRYLLHSYTDPTGKIDRTAKRALVREKFLELVDVDEQTESFLISDQTIIPGLDTLRITWTKTSPPDVAGTSLDVRLDALLVRFGEDLGLLP